MYSKTPIHILMYPSHCVCLMSKMSCLRKVTELPYIFKYGFYLSTFPIMRIFDVIKLRILPKLAKSVPFLCKYQPALCNFKVWKIPLILAPFLRLKTSFKANFILLVHNSGGTMVRGLNRYINLKNY